VGERDVGGEEIERISRAIGDLMRVASSDRVHAARQRATGVDISQTELRFLAVVDDTGPSPVTELGAVLHLSQPTASRTLRRLEDEGLVRRRVDASDGRVARYAITPAGRRVRLRFQAYMAEQLDRALETMPPERRGELAALLEELVTGTHRAADGEARATQAGEETSTRSLSRTAKAAASTGREK
jgi:DNA-binding MarR family transcriptional regulator